MSENIKADSDALREFAGFLNNLSRELQISQGNIRGAFHQVSLTWRDNVQQQFAQEFQEVNRALDQFLQEVSQEHIPHLQRKAKDIEDYRNNGSL